MIIERLEKDNIENFHNFDDEKNELKNNIKNNNNNNNIFSK